MAHPQAEGRICGDVGCGGEPSHGLAKLAVIPAVGPVGIRRGSWLVVQSVVSTTPYADPLVFNPGFDQDCPLAYANNDAVA